MNLQAAKLLIIVFEVGLLLTVLGVLVYDQVTGVLDRAPIVRINGGKVRGIIQDVDPRLKIYLYQGIRYGRAERFQKAKPVEPWPGIYQATTPRNSCPMPKQNKAKRYFSKGISEDCLFINVWRPISEQMEPRAVMVYIYGGGFDTGSIFKVTHDGRYIAGRGDVIVVSMNYRLGAFGFLYSGDGDAIGNQGMYDQILALRWVRDNIAYFGGDPNKVTIFGNSAGSNAVGMLLLSPLTKGLFHRAILQSGVPFDLLNRNDSLKATTKLATQLNCPTDKMQSTLECLKSKSVEDILNGTKEAGDPFNPMYGDELMPLRTVETLNTGTFYPNIDLMFGVVKDEGPTFIDDDLPHLAQNVTLTLQSTKDDIVQLLSKQSYAKEVAEFYTANLTNPTQSDLRNIIGTAYGDYSITCPVILFGEQFGSIAPNHRFYSWKLMKKAGRHVIGDCKYDWMGVCHADDLFYLFTIPDQVTSDEKRLSRDIIQAWANFAQFGDPGKIGNVQWEEAFDRRYKNQTITRYMALDPNNYTMVDGYYKRTCDDFWRPKLMV